MPDVLSDDEIRRKFAGFEARIDELTQRLATQQPRTSAPTLTPNDVISQSGGSSGPNPSAGTPDPSALTDAYWWIFGGATSAAVSGSLDYGEFSALDPLYGFGHPTISGEFNWRSHHPKTNDNTAARFWARMWVRNDTDQTFNVNFWLARVLCDGGLFNMAIDYQAPTGWVSSWENSSPDIFDEVVSYNLAPGDHVIDIFFQRAATKLCEVLITTDLLYQKGIRGRQPRREAVGTFLSPSTGLPGPISSIPREATDLLTISPAIISVPP